MYQSLKNLILKCLSGILQILLSKENVADEFHSIITRPLYAKEKIQTISVADFEKQSSFPYESKKTIKSIKKIFGNMEI